MPISKYANTFRRFPADMVRVSPHLARTQSLYSIRGLVGTRRTDSLEILCQYGQGKSRSRVSEDWLAHSEPIVWRFSANMVRVSFHPVRS